MHAKSGADWWLAGRKLTQSLGRLFLAAIKRSCKAAEVAIERSCKAAEVDLIDHFSALHSLPGSQAQPCT